MYFPIEVAPGFLGLNLYRAFGNEYPANKVTNDAYSIIHMVPMINVIGDKATLNVTYQKDNDYFKWAFRPL
jgi:uncharacterized membrane protein